MSSQLPAEYIEVDSVDAAIELLASDADTRIVANGYSIVPRLKDGIETPDRLVDISGIDSLQTISREEGAIRIGALITHDRIAASPIVDETARALAEATDSVGDYQAKQQGTIGGNLVFADPKYDAPPAFLALNGYIVSQGPDGKRTIESDEWFQGPNETALRPDELVTDIVIPDAEHSSYIRTSAYSGYAIVGAATRLEISNGTVEAARVAVNGAKPYPIRLPNVEKTLVGEPMDDELRSRAAEGALQDTNPATLMANEAAAGRYRLRLVRSYCYQALEQATASY